TTLPFSQRPTDKPRSAHPDDAMLEFASESQVQNPPRPKRNYMGWGIGVTALTLLTVAGAWAFRADFVHIASSDGVLRVESDPPGAAVEVDGSLRGLTPLTVS